MSSFVRRCLAVLLGLGLILAATLVAAAPASARPNCDGDNPPPICLPDPPPPRYPDLQASISGPAAASSGTTTTYTITVHNPGGANPAPASGVQLAASVSSGATVSGAAGDDGFTCTRSGSAASCSGGFLRIGGVATITLSATMPNAAAQVTASATVDPANAIEERDESNNSALVTTTVTVPPRPDLAMTMTGPTSVRGIYEAGAWTMTITNQGTAPADPVNVRWLTNWGGDVNANAVKSGAIGFTCTVPHEYVQQIAYCYGNGPLAPGASATITITAVPPAPDNVYGPAGQSNVTATVDYQQIVTESNEGNNAASVNSTITW